MTNLSDTDKTMTLFNLDIDLSLSAEDIKAMKDDRISETGLEFYLMFLKGLQGSDEAIPRYTTIGEDFELP
jgi:hypothetical protein